MSTALKETLEAIKAARGGENLAKAFNVGLGLVNYDLESGAKKLYPVLTPLRNMIPRVKGNGDTATRWKAITGINVNNLHMGVSEGNRGGSITTTTANYTQPYVGLGLEDYVNFEADYAAEGFEDVKADAVLGLLQSFMIGEERMILGGNNSMALGTTPTPTLVAGTAGSMATQGAASVICVALTMDGFKRSSVANGVVQQIVRTNMDTSTDTINGGAAQKSASATVSVTGPNGSIAASVVPVRGAVGYAWLVGATAGTERIAAITTAANVVLTAYPGSGQLASALATADYSNDTTYNFDGLLTFALKAGSNAYYKALGNGSKLTSDGAGSVIEINDALQSFYDLYRLSPNKLLVNSQEARDINKLVVGNGGAPLIRFTGDIGNKPDSLIAGQVVGSFLNPITSQLVEIMVHPDMVAGTMQFLTESIPYPLSGIARPFQIKARKEYYQTDWPITKRRWEYGVYADELLQHYFPPSLGVITNITKQ